MARRGHTQSMNALRRGLDMAHYADAATEWLGRHEWRGVHGGSDKTADRDWERFKRRLRRYNIPHRTRRTERGAVQILLPWLLSGLAVDDAVERAVH